MTARTSTEALDLDRRLQALRAIVEVAGGRVAPVYTARARDVTDRAGARLEVGTDITIVVLAGGTGSGKSSLFNAIAGSRLSEVGVRRPTTGVTHACAWGLESDRALDWLDVKRRHHVADPPDELRGLVLLDLPDHDSTDASHVKEVDRLMELVDLMVWVVDPQKYADAAVHDRYLKPLATHSDVTMVVLNKADLLTSDERVRLVADLRSVLARDGLTNVAVLTTSIVNGEGLSEINAAIADKVRERRAATARLAADVDRVVIELEPLCGGTSSKQAISKKERKDATEALAGAAGVDTVVGAVGGSYRREATLATGWPFTRWLRRLRPDPLRRLHLGDSSTGGRTSLPTPSPVQRARVESTMRALAASAGTSVAEPWRDRLRGVTSDIAAALPDDLDRAVSSTPLGAGRAPRWWQLGAALQLVLATVAILGFLWLTVLFALQWLQIPRPPIPEVERVPVPTVMLAGGLLAGLIVAFVFARLAAVGARRRRRVATRRLRDAIDELVDAKVLAQVNNELEAHASVCRELAIAAGKRRPARATIPVDHGGTIPPA